MKRLPASATTRERLAALFGGLGQETDIKGVMVRAAVRLIVEEGPEGEVSDALGRGYYEHGRGAIEASNAGETETIGRFLAPVPIAPKPLQHGIHIRRRGAKLLELRLRQIEARMTGNRGDAVALQRRNVRPFRGGDRGRRGGNRRVGFEWRTAFAPRGGFLVCIRHAKHGALVEGPAHELQREGKPALAESRALNQGRAAGHVERGGNRWFLPEVKRAVRFELRSRSIVAVVSNTSNFSYSGAICASMIRRSRCACT